MAILKSRCMRGRRPAALLVCLFLLVSCGTSATKTPPAIAAPQTTSTNIAVTVTQAPGSSLEDVLPRPFFAVTASGTFSLSAETSIYVEPETGEVRAIGQYLADHLNPATGFTMKVQGTRGTPGDGGIYLTLSGGDASLGDEGYELTITPDLVRLVANQPAGLFHGIQTIRQLLPATIEESTLQSGPWKMDTGTIRDRPRFAWRGAMLDVARHFFAVKDIEHYLDLLAYYKFNRLHLHLADDQGWRIEIKTWPELAKVGGSSEVGGGPGGYYSQADYAALVAYAQSRYITIVPEIDIPGHVNAALASYPELNCNGTAPPLYTGTDVGFSSLCIDKDITYRFVEDVVREIASLTPGPYLHMGGDEASATNKADYIKFVEQVQSIVQSHGKQMVGWEEIAQAHLLPSSIAQHWNPGEGFAKAATLQGARVIMSPADKAYLDMKYDASTALGLNWAGFISVEQAYSWDPAAVVSSLQQGDILGVEAPLWSETLLNLQDIEYMAFPRLLGFAEIGWSDQAARNWSDYRLRLAAQGSRLEAMGVNFYKSPDIPWR